MTVYLLIAVPLASGIVLWAVGIDPRTWFTGTGKRRYTRQSAAEAGETIRDLEMQLAAARKRACRNCGERADSGMPSRQEIAESDAADTTPKTRVPAPADNGCRDTPLAAAETARDETLAALARPGEEQLLADLERARAAAVTAVIPIVANPLRAAVDARLNIPSPHPLSSATAVPADFPERAHIKVTAALNEAS